jgi:hypothetical protein
MFCFDLHLLQRQNHNRPTGGVLHYFWLAELLNKHGVSATVKLDFFPDYIEKRYEQYISDDLEGRILIIPEVFFGHYLAHNIDCLPFIWESNLLADGIEFEANAPCLCPTPYMRGSCYEAGFNPLYVPFFLPDESIRILSEPVEKDIKLATVPIEDRKRPFDIEAGKIHIIPKMPHEEFLKELRRVKVFVYPSRLEGLGLPMLEAMASGAVVYGGDTQGSTDLIRHGVTGFIIDNRQELAETLPFYDPLIGKQAQTFVQNFHSESAVAGEILRTFKKISDTIVVA